MEEETKFHWTDDQKNAVKDYICNSGVNSQGFSEWDCVCDEINRMLNNGETLQEPYLSFQINLDQAFLNTGFLENELTVYRGIDLTEVEDKFPIGPTITHHGYASTSISSDVALSFIKSSEGLLMEIDLPQGLKVILPRYLYPNQNHENEVILSRGLNLKCISLVKTNTSSFLAPHHNGKVFHAKLIAI